MSKIRVHVVHYKDCANLVMRYVDDVTGKTVRSTVYRDPKTGEETPTTLNRKFAKKLAAQWEADLNAGRDQGRHAITWAQFRLRYEDEVAPSMAVRTGNRIGTVFNAVEKILPKVANGKLVELNAEAISRLQAEWRSNKRSENTIVSNLAHLRSALMWAVEQELILVVPKIKKPQRAKKRGRGTKSKGRPITTEEFERMLGKVRPALEESKTRKRETDRKTRQRAGRKVRQPQDAAPIEISPATIESWRRFLRGLWVSGLRLEESLNLYWDRHDRLHIDLSGKRPMLIIPAELEKGGRDRRLPIVPDFAEFLMETSVDERHGPVFSPLTLAGNRATYDQAGRMVSIIGELARVIVHTYPKTGKVKFASAHDLRRSYGSRWARKVGATMLQLLMRHESIATTTEFYVDIEGDDAAETLWELDRAQKSTVLGTVDVSAEDSASGENDLSLSGE